CTLQRCVRCELDSYVMRLAQTPLLRFLVCSASIASKPASPFAVQSSHGRLKSVAVVGFRTSHPSYTRCIRTYTSSSTRCRSSSDSTYQRRGRTHPCTVIAPSMLG
ncbi:unnamed protein product, partial [Sphacelaria rigidula]